MLAVGYGYSYSCACRLWSDCCLINGCGCLDKTVVDVCEMGCVGERGGEEEEEGVCMCLPPG